jgi:hypothetical protein
MLRGDRGGTGLSVSKQAEETQVHYELAQWELEPQRLGRNGGRGC